MGRCPTAWSDNRLIRNVVQYRWIYLMMLPGIAYFLVFKYGPMYGLLIAFKDFQFTKGILGSPSVGFKHFLTMFHSSSFFNILRNTVLIQVYKLAFTFFAPVILSLMLNEVRHTRFKKVLQTIVYLPHFLSWVIVGGIFLTLLGPRGDLNAALALLGLPTPNWMMEPRYFRSIVVLSSLWKEAGWGTIIYLAAMSAIDPSLYEAATVDGTRKLQSIRYITLPSLVPVMIMLFILQIGHLLEAGFEQIFVLYNPMVYEVGDVFSTYIYRIGLQGMQFSYTTAIGIFESLIGFLLVLGSNRLTNRLSNGEFGLW